MGFHSGWEVPHWFVQPGDDPGYKPSFYRTNWFEPVGREVELVLNRVAIADLSAFAKIEVKGKDATMFMDYLVANKLPAVNLLLSSIVLSTNQLFRKQASNLIQNTSRVDEQA